MINAPKIIIIGGGAAGMVAAIAAKQTNPYSEIVILEKNNRLGKKLLATGNGRCNIGNANVRRDAFFFEGGQSPDFIEVALARYPMAANCDFFAKLGLLLKEEDEGKLFPYSNQAASVLDRLRLALADLGVAVAVDSQVVAISKLGKGFVVEVAQNSLAEARSGKAAVARAGKAPAKTIKYSGDKVILACGGVASPQLSNCQGIAKIMAGLGHKFTNLFPSLVQVKTENTLPKALKGTKIQGIIKLFTNGKLVAIQKGEILFTEYGVSGPPVFQLSRLVSANFAIAKPARQKLEIDLMPEYSQGKVGELLAERQKNLVGSLEDFLTGMVNKRLGQQLLKACGLAPLSRLLTDLSASEIAELAACIKALPLEVMGTTGWQNAQVMAGGLSLSGFEAATLESKTVAGLYAAGEILDIDGCCGGYNLAWAWSSGRLAGCEAAKN